MSTNTNALRSKGAGVNTSKQNFNTYTPIHSEIDRFRQAMQSAGIHYSGDIIADGKLHRFYIEGHKQGSKNGAYTLHLDDRPAGWFMDYRTGVAQTWRSGNVSSISYDFTQQIKEAKQQRESEIRQKQAEAAHTAKYIWSKSRPIAKKENHQYLITKNIQQHNARIYRESLVIPIFDQSDSLVNLQFITPEGEKRFLSDGRKKGCFHILGGLSERILICEGFATGASLHEDSAQRVVVAFDAGNLLPVAMNIHELSPSTEIIICGDNDLSGIGQSKAKEAALAIGGKVLIPPAPGQDWNDLIAGGRQYA